MLIVDYECLCGQVIGLRLLLQSFWTEKLDTVLKFLKVGSASVFFGRGVTTACLNPSGISPCMSDMFITLLILGNSISIQSFSNDVGIGSRLHDFGAADKINFLISSLLRGWKELSGVTSTVLS